MLNKIEKEKLETALELKFLIGQTDPIPQVKTRIRDIINTFEPFSSCPLTEAPPAELFDCMEPILLEKNIREEAAAYTYVVMAGEVHVKSRLLQNEKTVVRSFIDLDELDKLSGDYLDSELVTGSNTFVLKIGQIWRDQAVKEKRQAKINYCRSKLKQIDFFLGLTYGDFTRLCENCVVMEFPANSVLIEAGKVPKHLYCLVEGLVQADRQVSFRVDPDLEQVFREEAVKNNPNLGQFIEQLIQDPTEEQIKNGETTLRKFSLKELHPLVMLCGRETLEQLPIPYNLRVLVKSKVIAFNYASLYNIDKEKMREIKTIKEPFETSAREIRRMYYAEAPWLKYRQFLLNENLFAARTREFNYNRQLRGPMDLNTNKYEFVPDPSMFMGTHTISKEELTSNPIRKIESIQRALLNYKQQKDA